MIEEFLAMLNYWFRHCEKGNGDREEEIEDLEEEDIED